MLTGIAISLIPFSRQMEDRAKTELTLLMDRAFARISTEDQQTEPIVKAEEENLLSKAVAVSRFLTHDDSLLASDALLALCEQLAVDKIDVADAEGTLIASSDAARIGTALGTQEAFSWTMAAADDTSAALMQADADDPSVLYACVGRSDIEGFILLTRDDSYVESALMLASTESVTSDLPYSGDLLFEAAEAGTDGFFYDSGNLCLRRTQDGVTMIAARPLTEVFAFRNAALLGFGAALVCVMICGVAAYLLNLEVVTTEDDEMIEQIEPENEAALLQDNSEFETYPEDEPRPRKRLFKKRGQTTEEPVEQAEAEVEQQHEQSLEHAPRQVVRGRKKTRTQAEEAEEKNDEDAFEKIVE